MTKGPGFGGPDFVARLSPVHLPDSKQVRMERLFGQGLGQPGRVQGSDQRTQLPLRKRDGGVVDQVAEIMGDLIPDSPDRAASLPSS